MRSTCRWPLRRRSAPTWCWPTTPMPTGSRSPSPIRPPTAAGVPSPATSSARCSPTTSSARAAHTSDEVLATTVVSSRLLSKLAAAAGLAYGEGLTGFKWVVRTPLPGQRFLFGYEEALGYCVGTLVRDKDGVTAALVAAELAARPQGRGVARSSTG